jgi:hypothetical protein
MFKIYILYTEIVNPLLKYRTVSFNVIAAVGKDGDLPGDTRT